jgi:hypothetical protein
VPLRKVKAEGDTFFANDWSPDGNFLAGEVWHSNGVAVPGIVTYSFGSREFRSMTDSGVSPVWLADNRRLLFLKGERLYCLDTRDGQTRAVGSRLDASGRSAPDLRIGANSSFALSRDDREIYFVKDTSQGAIWQMTIR